VVNGKVKVEFKVTPYWANLPNRSPVPLPKYLTLRLFHLLDQSLLKLTPRTLRYKLIQVLLPLQLKLIHRLLLPRDSSIMRTRALRKSSFSELGLAPIEVITFR
jgi:hypothetical protein